MYVRIIPYRKETVMLYKNCIILISFLIDETKSISFEILDDMQFRV